MAVNSALKTDMELCISHNRKTLSTPVLTDQNQFSHFAQEHNLIPHTNPWHVPSGKYLGRILKLDPTPISGLGILRCPWENTIGCQCNDLTPKVTSSSSCLPKAVEGTMNDQDSP
ncbi:hypothetical protein TNCV_1683911 [Trichonephila clavipes]|nr:hypothetical protein TNCV_1683911 [Trichonephila clavipes]